MNIDKNIYQCCALCSRLHYSGFCEKYRTTVPEDARENKNGCKEFSFIDPGRLAANLSENTTSGPGSPLAAFFDAESFFRYGTIPGRYLLPINPAYSFILKSILDKIEM